MRFASLGSGSKGNATLIQHKTTTVMVDCGFSVRETEKRLARLQLAPDTINALFVTHEHGDHIRGVGPFARKYQLPVFLTRGTAKWNGLGNIPNIHYLSVDDSIEIGGLTVKSFAVPHDANEPCQFVISDHYSRFAMLTDVGHCTEHIKTNLRNCDALLLECNFDKTMLQNGCYPQVLKDRVAGRYGHLSNEQAAEILKDIQHEKLRKIVIAHVSEKNNQTVLAYQTLRDVLTIDTEISLLDQEHGIDWQNI